MIWLGKKNKWQRTTKDDCENLSRELIKLRLLKKIFLAFLGLSFLWEW
jgi:hypothetical protein